MADINSLNQEIADLRKQLGDKPLTPFDSKDLDKALLTAKALRQEFRESSSDLDYIAKSFKDSVNELSRQNIYLNLARKSISGIADISRQVVDYRRGENVLSEKQLKNLQNQARVKFDELKLAIRSGQLTKSNLKEAQSSLDEQEKFNNSLNRTIELQAQVNKEIGLLGSGLEGAGKLLEKMGFTGIAKPISDAIKETKEARLQYKLNQDAISDIGKEMSSLNTRNLSDAQIRMGFGGKELKTLLAQKEALKEQNKELDKQTNKYKNIAISLKEQFTLTNMTDAILGKMIKSFFDLDEAQTKFKNLTGGQIPLMDQFNGRLITSVDYIKTAGSLTEQLGVNAAAVFSPDTLASAAEMVKSMGMTQEQANKAAIMSQVNGQSVDDMNKSLKEGNKQYNSQNRSALAQGVIMREVYSTSTAIAASMGNSVTKIGEAVRQAKDLGLSLAEVDGVANSLLDVESSIAKEFEYEVISGKQINLEAARYYALTNQTDKLTKEIAKNQSIIQSFASGNRIEQEAAAAALGLSRDQLAEMYMADLRKSGLTDKEIAKAMAMDEKDVKRLSTQEAINTSIAKMTELLAGPLQLMTSLIDNAYVLYGIMGAIGGIIMTQMVLGVIQMGKGLIMAIPKLAIMLGLESGIAAAKISGAMAATVGLGAIAILGGIALGVGAMMSSVKGAQSPPGLAEGGTVTSGGNVMVGEKGPEMLSLKPGATVTPLNKINAATIASPSTPQQSQTIDYDKMAAAMSRVTIQVETYLDGVKVSNELKVPMGITTRKL